MNAIEFRELSKTYRTKEKLEKRYINSHSTSPKDKSTDLLDQTVPGNPPVSKS